MAKAYFTPKLFSFLKDLKKNNNRDWFLENKERYETHVKAPSLEFIADIAPILKKINRHLIANPKPHGGSLFRIYRDIRFSEDKSPYKTHIGMNFPHERGKGMVHVPGFYLHLESGQCFAAGGLWHPDSRTLNAIRSAILNRTSEWKKIVDSGPKLQGDSLTRPPKGYSSDHPLIADLKRKDFIQSVMFTEKQICSSSLVDDFAEACRKMNPLTAFLSKALGLP